METKQLFATGNLYTGYPFGVATEDHWKNTELHGPFSYENEARNYAVKLSEEFSDYASIVVCRIETPQVGTSVLSR